MDKVRYDFNEPHVCWWDLYRETGTAFCWLQCYILASFSSRMLVYRNKRTQAKVGQKTKMTYY
jgi:hypothetical protein